MAPAVGFFGRAAELGALAVALKMTGGGDGRRVLLIQGEPGMGKTTLCAEFARAAHIDGAVVLYGRCEDELGVPYQPFAEALAHYVAHASRDDLMAHFARHGSELVALVPGVAERLGELAPSAGGDAESQRHLLFAAVAAGSPPCRLHGPSSSSSTISIGLTRRRCCCSGTWWVPNPCPG